ncbi:MAG: hypothetical protein H6739_17610 [Alphaproteobacteria bacterium]|nr:hypothetical protein [Alphaproteobacteria bacterium]
MTALVGEVRAREALCPRDAEAMLSLMRRHFHEVHDEVFLRDLAEKDRVILLRDPRGAVRGFSTMQVSREALGGTPATVVFSGDTVVDRDAWGSPVLPQTWLRAVLEVGASTPDERLYWLLICSGYRTYRFLPLFYREFWPRHDAPTPPPIRAAMERLARRRYGARYAGGVVRFPDGAHVRSEVGGLTPARLRNPHVAFFARQNPGHTAGDELVCLAEVCRENFTPAAMRMLRAVGGG